MLRKIRFVKPSMPVLKKEPPLGPEWMHEVKFDGWRAQLHRDGAVVVIYSRKGFEISRRFRPIRDSLLALPTRQAIIDAELVSCDAQDKPDFSGLMAGSKHGLCAWCFDLLYLDGIDLRAERLDVRRVRLRHLLAAADEDALRFSEDFLDPEKLLAATDCMRLAGIVSKRRDEHYRSGKNPGWIKVKTATWRAANRARYKLFEGA